MSQDRPWVERLLQRQWQLLAVALAVAVVTSATWLFLAFTDGRPSYEVVASQAVFRSGDSTWQISAMQVVDALPDGTQPAPGAAFVVADVDTVLTGFPSDGGCVWRLHVGDDVYLSSTYLPDDPGLTAWCVPGQRATVRTVYEVPRSRLDRVDGLVLSIPDHPRVLLTARLS